MIVSDKFQPLTELTVGTVITLYNSINDLYRDNKGFPVYKEKSTSKVPELYYVRSGNNYKVCGLKSEIEKFVRR